MVAFIVNKHSRRIYLFAYLYIYIFIFKAIHNRWQEYKINSSIVKDFSLFFLQKLRKKREIETNAGYVEQKKSKTNKHVVQNVNAIASGYPSQHAMPNGYPRKTVAPKTLQVMPKSTLAFKIDIVFRTILPFFYVIFCCSYFTYYLIVVWTLLPPRSQDPMESWIFNCTIAFFVIYFSLHFDYPLNLKD